MKTEDLPQKLFGEIGTKVSCLEYVNDSVFPVSRLPCKDQVLIAV